MSDPNPPSGTASEAEATPEQIAEAREQLQRVRAELAETPVKNIVANHAIGLWQLALLHLGLDDPDRTPNLAEAKLAIDAMASLVEGVSDRLEDHTEPLTDALTTVRLAFVRLSSDSGDPGDDGPSPDREAPAEP
ncbi:MAG TPA: DUF1844 domain-containing protein [Acidimicrobiia bacterium]|nr:DUF1844 domain-containing protein [Acidimicrobiia bacterium]